MPPGGRRATVETVEARGALLLSATLCGATSRGAPAIGDRPLASVCGCSVLRECGTGTCMVCVRHLF